MAVLADEALIVSFTPVEDTDDQIMRPAIDWDDPAFGYTWWMLSRGLYERVFENLGFSVEFMTSTAVMRAGEHMVDVERPTIVARRL